MEFRKMRRINQQMKEEECIDILNRNTSGVLAASGDGGYPYAVPLSYLYYENAIYFHCAKSGHKIDAVNNCSRVSFCVVDQDCVIPQKYTTYYRSVIVFGRASIMKDEEEIRRAIEMLAIKYYPEDSSENRSSAINREYAAMAMIKIEIEHMTGKEAKELAAERKAKKS